MNITKSNLKYAANFLLDYTTRSFISGTSKGISKSYQLVENLSSSNYFLISEVSSRIVALSLPIFHLFSSLSYYALGAVIKCISLQSPFDNEHDEGGCYWKLAKYNLIQVISSVYHIAFPKEKSLNNPKNLIAALPKKSVLCRIGYPTRIGSNIVGYVKAMWIVHCLKKRNPDVEFVYARFNMDDHFKFSKEQKHVLPEVAEAIPRFPGAPLVEGFKTYGTTNGTRDFKSIDEIGDFFEHNDGVVELIRKHGIDSTQIRWNDPDFKAFIRDQIQLSSDIELSSPPKDGQHYSIALHVRTGEDFDPPGTNFKYPKKIPPISFYKYAMDQAIAQRNGRKVYIRIFTDSLTPKKLREEFQEYIQDRHPNLEFQIDVCEDLQQQKDSVLSDMFSMLEYNALVRSHSGLSLLLGNFADYEFEIYPSKCVKQRNKTALTEVSQIIRAPANSVNKTITEAAVDFELLRS